MCTPEEGAVTNSKKQSNLPSFLEAIRNIPGFPPVLLSVSRHTAIQMPVAGTDCR